MLTSAPTKSYNVQVTKVKKKKKKKKNQQYIQIGTYIYLLYNLREREGGKKKEAFVSNLFFLAICGTTVFQ